MNPNTTSVWESLKDGFVWIFRYTLLVKLLLLLLSLVGFGEMFSWEFACVLVLAVYFHEYGHLYVMNLLGVKNSGIHIIPFLGGVILHAPEQDIRKQGWITLGGPIGGIVSCGILFLIGASTKNTFWWSSLAWIAFLNAANLLPISPLDGGILLRNLVYSCSAHSGKILLASWTFVCIAATIYYQHPLPLFIAGLATYDALMDTKRSNHFQLSFPYFFLFLLLYTLILSLLLALGFIGLQVGEPFKTPTF